MELRKWDELPPRMQTDAVKAYYDRLCGRKREMQIIRAADLILASLLTAILFVPSVLIAALVVIDSPGNPFFIQRRITQYGRAFPVLKFRTMNSRKSGTDQCFTDDSSRVTRVGKVLRKYRLDEIPQLINIIAGDMTFVGTRPEVGRYVRYYNESMMATLLLPAGLTSDTSIRYRDEAEMLADSVNPEETYVGVVLPEKMNENLKELQEFSFRHYMRILMKTVRVVFISDPAS